MGKFEFREIGQGETFSPISITEDAPFTQAGFYGDWQKGLGRVVRRFTAYADGEVVAYFQLIAYPLLSGKTYLYAPYGPVVQNPSEEFLAALKEELRRIAGEEHAAFVRLDFTPPIPRDTLAKFFTQAPIATYHAAYFQPRVEWMLDLDKSEEELLMAMHEKTRYSIRLAWRKEVETDIITENFDQYFDAFYELMTETARRNGFGLHHKEYYEQVFRDLPPNSYLSVARHGEKVLAIDLIIVFGKTAHYVFGGSRTEERNRMPAYAAQWRAICHAKELECAKYNFGGIADDEGAYQGWEGLTAFKKKFGGREVRHAPFFDVVANPFWYALYVFRKSAKRFGI
ncbi:MAG: peptidoglycan bridge formation glycyltransferase FemA/FemB family protein [Patescibacteria group bacterium]|nr:peptidoglycan bridge formation glycyltransferase FemA/FemB family protein [Patescibacteria group bacterium]